MSDPRLTPFSGRFALESLRGQVKGVCVAGEAARIGAALADLSLSPGGERARQVVHGTAVLVIERRGAEAFVQIQPDGYCGWLPAAALAAPVTPSHVVTTRATHLYREASIKRGEHAALSLGARVTVTGTVGSLAETPDGFVPLAHLAPLDPPEPDAVAVAERLLGTPYLWGGNSSAGIDCSGLVQLALTMTGRVCPGDSDLQRAAFGAVLPETEPTRRGDLFFWAGHVAMACDETRLIHANGYTMSVAHEPIGACLARIAAEGGSRYFGRKRP